MTRSQAGFHGVVLVVLVGLGGLRLCAAPDLFDELHARIAAAEAKRQTVRARFIETTASSLLVKPMVARGTLLGSKPASMVINYTAPEGKTIIMDGKRLVIIHPDRSESERVDVTEIMTKVNHYFTNASPDQLRRAFNFRVFVDPEAPGTYQMDLLPKRKQIKQGLERLQLWVGRDSYMLSQIKITFAGGDTTVFKLEDVELNVPIPPHAFDIDIPPTRQK
jgi:outer membrane lipoprotein-sorting protein